MTKQQWLDRCAAHFVKLSGMKAHVAMEYAEAQLEVLKDDLTEDPEDAAEEEMSNWTD